MASAKLFPNRHTDSAPQRSGKSSPRGRRRAAERMAMSAHLARANAPAQNFGIGAAPSPVTGSGAAG